MRVLFVTSERGLRGGERQVLLLRESLEARGVEVGLCAREGAALLERFERRWACPMANGLDPRGALGIRRAADAFGAEVVHAFSARAHGLALASGRPLVVTRAVAFEAGKSALGRLKYRRPVEFLAISRAVADCLTRAGAPAGRVHLVPPAIRFEQISTDRAAARERLELPDDRVVVGCAAALEGEKGIEDLIAASRLLAASAPHRLVLVGDGTRRAALEAAAAGLDARFLGWREDLQGLLAGFDLYVQPSRSEGFGVAVAEAMAAGVPVVATEAGGLRDLVEHGVTGLLAPVGDAERLAARMAESLADRAAAAARAGAARERVRARLAPEAMAEATLKVYERALAR